MRLRQSRRIEYIEPAGTAKTQPAVTGAKVGPEIEFLTLESVFPVEGFDGTTLRVKAHQSRVSAQPQLALRVGQHTVDRVAGQAVAMCIAPEPYGLGMRRGT